MNLVNKKAAYIGCLGLISIISTEFGIIGILPQLATYYQIEIGTAGYLLSAFALVIALTGPFMVLYTSRFDRKKVMLLAIGMFLLSNALSVLAPPFWLLLIIRVLPAFLQPVFVSIAITTALEGATEKMQPRLMSIVVGGIAIAQVTVIPLSTYVSAWQGWEAAFVIQGLISLSALLAIFYLLPPIPVEEPKTFGSQLKILKRKSFLINVITNFLIIAAWFCTYGYFADYLAKEKGLSAYPENTLFCVLTNSFSGVQSGFPDSLLAINRLVICFFYLG